MWWDSSNRGSSRKGGSSSGSTSKRASAKKGAARKRSAKARRPAAVSRANKIRIFLADNQPIDRVGMVALLHSQPDFEVVGESASAEEAAKQCKHLLPSLAILALRLPAPEGTTALAVIRNVAPEIPILAVAERGEGTCMVLNPPRSGRLPEQPGNGCSTGTDCLQLAVVQGATGTIRRSAEAEELFRAVRTVASGKAWYEAGTATAIMRHALARHGDGHHPSLSDRETEVAELISDGRSNKEIAQALTISEPTVKKHVGHILGKLKLQDRLQVGLYIARNPLVLHRGDRARQ